MNLTNYHSHCSFCDGQAPAEEFVKSAISAGFTAYGISSHAPLPQGPCSACDLPPGRRTRGGSGFTSSPFQLSPSVSRLRGGGGTHKEELRLFHILRDHLAQAWHTWLVSSKHKPVAAGRSTCPTRLPCMRVASLISLEYTQSWHTPLRTSGCGPEGA